MKNKTKALAKIYLYMIPILCSFESQKIHKRKKQKKKRRKNDYHCCFDFYFISEIKILLEIVFNLKNQKSFFMLITYRCQDNELDNNISNSILVTTLYIIGYTFYGTSVSYNGSNQCHSCLSFFEDIKSNYKG